MKKLLLGAILLFSILGFGQRYKEHSINKEEFIKQHNAQFFNELSFDKLIIIANQASGEELSNITGLRKGATGIGMSMYYGTSKTIGVEMTYVYKSVIVGAGFSIGQYSNTEGIYIDKPLTHFQNTSKVEKEKTSSYYIIYGYHIKSKNKIDEFRICLKTGVGNTANFQNFNGYLYKWNTQIEGFSDLLIGGNVGLGSRDFFVDFGYDTYNKVTIGITYVL